MKMYQNEIKITAFNSESENWRLIRLERIIGYICALSNDLLNKISELNDSKGTLTVKWKVKQKDKEKEMLINSWESIIGDGSNNVKHEYS